MTKVYILITFLVTVLFVQAQTLPIDGVVYTVDTLENHQVGPGTQFVSIRLTAPDKRLDVFFLKTDIKNPHVEIRTALGCDSIYNGETPSNLAKRISTEGNFYFAGTNGDFYNTEALYFAYPGSGNMVNGEVTKIPGIRNVFTIDEQRIPDIGVMAYNGNVKFGASTWAINSVNHLREIDKLVLFNRHNGKYTHTDALGTEVLIELLEGNAWGSNKTLKAKVLKIEKGLGNMAIPKGKAVLSGNGIAADKLNQLSVNDEIDLRLNLTINKNSVSNFLQMTGGDAYKIMLLNGVLEQTSVWVAREPRTGLGYSENKNTLIFCVVDGRKASIGVSTKELAQIMQSAGAYTAFNMDGGGSSAMYIAEYGGPVNEVSGSAERATANSLFIVSTAPTDNAIGNIKPCERSISLPKYAEYIPKFYGYNQYGVLLTSDLKGVVLSCPTSLGTIVNNKFIATGNTAGNITATYNGNLKATIPVSFIPVSEIKIRLDSVIVDNRSDYAIEVLAKTTVGESLISPSALSWNVNNVDVCRIENGTIKGLKNGTTTATGQVDNVTGDLKIKVEIPKAPTMIGDSMKVANWTVSSSSFLNAELNQKNLPKNWEHGAGVNFVYAAGRSPYIKLSNQCVFYGLPDTIKLVMNIGDISISRALVTLRPNNSTKTSLLEFTSFKQNQDFSLNIPVNKVLDANDRAIYPIWFDNVHFFLGTAEMTESKAYTLAIKDILLVYKNFVISGIANITTNNFSIYPNPVQGNDIHIQFKEQFSIIDYEILNLSGQKVMQQQSVTVNANKTSISTIGLEPGCYFLNIIQNQQKNTLKIIKR